MFDLSFQIERERLSAQIVAEVEAQSIAAFQEDEPRWHLGASIIGHACERYAWNTFRWLKKEQFSGRMYRLFNRGHLEEPRFIERLRGVGFEVFEFDENGKQYKISGVKGHYGGSLDGVVIAPERYGLPGPLLAEFKTHGDKSFTKLKKEGVRKSKPQHYSQMCAYGQAYNLPFGLYCAVNKNTDELYFEIVALDFEHGKSLYAKAERVITSQTPPPKIGQSAAYFECKFCDFSAICHYAAPPERNCRSCDHAFAADNGEWYCRVFEGIIQRENVPKGCPQYRRIV